MPSSPDISTPFRILIAEDNADDVELIVRELRRAGYSPEWQHTDNEADYLARLHPDLDIILSDFAMPSFGGLRALEILREKRLNIPFIIISGTIGEDAAVAVMQQGATDYLLKDRLARLGQAVQRALEQGRLRRLGEQADASLRLFRALLDQTSDRIEVIDPATGCILDVNAIGCREMGYTREEYLRLRVADLLPLGTVIDWPALAEDIRQSNSFGGESIHRRKDGSLFPIEFNAKWVSLDRDYIVSVVRDITTRKQNEEIARRSAEQIAEQAALIDHAHDAIVVHDLEERLIFWSKGAERLHGYTAEEALGRSIRELIQPETALFQEAWQSVLCDGIWVGEMQNRTRSGGKMTLEHRWNLVLDAQGEPKSVLSMATDITDRKQLEEQFLRAQRLESIGTLAGGIAHDLNNVLSPILLSLELLKRRHPDPESQNFIGLIETSAQRGADMVQQVLSFARGVAGRKLEVQVAPLLEDIEKIANETFQKNIRIHTIIPRNLHPILGDPTQLHQILLNLCVNARDSMPDGGYLTLSARNCLLDRPTPRPALGDIAQPGQSASDADRPKPYVFIEVEDTGSGIAVEVIEKIFDPFFTTKAIGQGTGLGLSTTLAIVKSHGGFIQVESTPGQGTKFKIHLPAHLAPIEATPSTNPAESASLPSGHGEFILVVDDEPSIRELTRQTLEAFGYRALTASDGTEALAIYARRMPEIAVVLTDIMMPTMDGLTTIRILRKINPAVRIIAASGLTADKRLAALGVPDFLPKPYTSAALLRALQKILSAPAAATV